MKKLFIEKTIIIKGSCTLEGVVVRRAETRGLIITHPHPLFGGDMNNPVVKTVAKTFSDAGYTTLRFNFRGVGASQGEFADGQGEVDDLLAARNYLIDIGIKDITLAGYSFGAWVIVNAVATGKIDADPKILISPPAAMLPFAKTLKLPHLKQVITGEMDEIAPPEQIKELIKNWKSDTNFSIIEECDHFFSGYLHNLTSILNNLINQNGPGDVIFDQPMPEFGKELDD